MNVLLAGGAGYIGSHVYLSLVQSGYDPIIVDDLVNSKEEAIQRLEVLTKNPVRFVRANICDLNMMKHVFGQCRPEVVIHLAGLKAVNESISQPLCYYQNNIDSTIILCKLMEEYSVRKMVFSSSATVYGQKNASPFREDMETGGCINPYGWTKYMNEQILQDFAKTQPCKEFVILRYFNPVGAHESGLIGEDPLGVPNNIMPIVCQVAYGKSKKLSVFGNDYPTQDGTCVRDYLHVMDLALGHVAACSYELGRTDHNLEIINLGTGRGYSVFDLITTFAHVNGVEIPYDITARRRGDLPSCFADVHKAKHVLKWSAMRGLEQMCIDSWRWMNRNPNGYT